jgi:hypothetical protein
MMASLYKPQVLLSIIFITLFSFISAQETSNLREGNTSIIAKEKSNVYNYKFEDAIRSIFKEYEGIDDIYKIESDCPRLNLEMDYHEAEIQFVNETFKWIENRKTKYYKAYKVISTELNNLN